MHIVKDDSDIDKLKVIAWLRAEEVAKQNE